MKSLILLIAVVLVTVGLLSCGSSPDNSGGRTIDNKDADPPKARQEAQKEETEEYIEDDYTEEEYIEDTDEPNYEYEDEDGDVPASEFIRTVDITPRPLRADSEIKIKIKTAAPLKENQSFKYTFWKNRNAMEETTEAVLPANTCKKNDVIFADVTLYEDDEMVARKRTALIPVFNSPPVVEEVTMPEIKGEGTYEFKVKAKDADDDQMTFSLELGEESADLDAQIDSATGNVTCNLSENPPDAMKFTIIADDGDGGVTKKVVSMRFFKHPKKEV